MCGEEFEVVNDHKSLEYIFTQKDLNLRQRKRLKLINEYKFKVKYHPGKTNVVADALNGKPRASIAHVVVGEWRVKGDVLKCLERPKAP